MRKTVLCCALSLVFGLGYQGLVYAQVEPKTDDKLQDDGRLVVDQDEEKPQGFWERDTLTGDWGGLRSELEDKGFTFSATQTSDWLGNINGGDKRAMAYDGLLNVAVDLDFGKMVGVKGLTGRVSGYVIQGYGLTQKAIGGPDNATPPMAITNAEVSPANTLLNEFWLQQSLFEDKFAIKLGALQADNYFANIDSAGFMVNSAWGAMATWAANLPGGGSQYPNAVPGVQLVLNPTPEWNIQAAFLNGTPNKGAMGDAYNTGLYFPLGNGVFSIAEVGYKLNPEGAEGSEGKLSGTYKLGGWYNSANFQSQTTNLAGEALSIGTEDALGDPRSYNSNYGIYLTLDQAVYREANSEDQGANVFGRFTISPQDRNMASWMGQLGVSYTGPFSGRPQDQIGFGYTYLGTSSSYKGEVTSYNGYQMGPDGSGVTVPMAKGQSFVELDYKAMISPWWSVQPFIQYVMNPGGNQAQQANPSLPVNNMTVLGLRTQVTF